MNKSAKAVRQRKDSFSTECQNDRQKKKKNFIDLNLTLYTKTNSGWIRELIINCETIQLSQHNIQKNLKGLVLGKDFLDMALKAQSVKKKS